MLVSEELAEVKWEYWRRSRDDNSHFKVDGIKLFPFHVATGERRAEATLLLFSGASARVKSAGIELLSQAGFTVAMNMC